MAAAGVASRLARLEAKVSDAGVAHVARRRAAGGVPAAEIEAELRRFFRLVRVRLDPYHDPRALAELIAEEYGANAAEVFRELRAARAGRKGQR